MLLVQVQTYGEEAGLLVQVQMYGEEAGLLVQVQMHGEGEGLSPWTLGAGEKYRPALRSLPPEYLPAPDCS